ncbi:sugar transferase [Georgenia sp. MJ173]|uniref:sugar transferase n=1 Tax=Georgenia sunbinii TaxID=3117728 RepID=UPI002F26AB5B
MTTPLSTVRPASSSLKRLTDVTLAIVALTLGAPVLIAICFTLRITQNSAAIFTQERHGLDGQPFKLYKFRTMKDIVDAQGRPLPDELRITRSGAFLRRTSLDELPELFNVLIGNMSIVGPRPLLPRYTPYFTAAERIRFNTRPGITGLAQINGRNAASWDERLALDIEYVANWSHPADAKIVLRTIKAVLTQAGVETLPTATMRDLDVERAERE